MVRNFSVLAQVSTAASLVGAGLLGFGSATAAHAQATPRITGPVDGSALVSLPGEVHPWARAQFDRGVAPASLSGHMLVVLKRSPEQETALQTFLSSQQDRHSPNYHKWLTPEDFGKRFGVADSDVQSVSGYLSSQGMRVGRVYRNRMAIEMEATAGQIRSAFQTEIHAYAVGGKTYYANNSNPQIPSALSKVVAGFASLNSFHVEGGSGAGTQATLDSATHTLKPLYTTATTNPNTYGVSPADLDVIYGIPASTAQGLGGQNVNVGIVGDSDINVQYVNNYRTIFGLPAKTPIVVVDGNDPGVNGDAYIAYKQIELVSAVAPNANIYYYTSATTDYDSGIYFALIRAVEDNQVQVLLNGFQECESAIGSDAMALVNTVAEEAAAQGITFVAAAGNSGAAGCAVPGTTGSAASAVFAVNGFATSPYLTAVGGTDFYYGTGSMGNYWNTSNGTGYLSVNTNPTIKNPPKDYLVGYFKTGQFQEQVWNDSYSSSNSVSSPSVQMASGGGPSTQISTTVTTDPKTGVKTTVPNPQPQPWYQVGKVSGISSTARVIPDVSFFAGSGANNAEGYNNTAYLFCMKSSDCLSTGTVQFTYSGGTEASSAVFAGAVALVVEQYNSSSRFGLGNVNPTLYSLFNSIVSHDVTIGSNELACSSGTNCANGHMSGYAAGSGYDAATGLGSFNILSFVSGYAPANTTASSVSLSVTDTYGNALPTCVVNGITSHCVIHSSWLKYGVSTTPSAATGDVAIFTSSPLQAESSVERLTLTNGTATDTWNLLPGGTYNIYARYAGDSTYAPSVSATPFPITVTPEACQMVVYGHNINVGSTSNIPYGTPVSITVEPYSAFTTDNVGIPAGSINVSDNGLSNIITTLPTNSEGAATFNSNLLAIGSHSIVLTYPGNASFNSCSTGAFLATVVKAPTTTTLNPTNADVTQGTISMTAYVTPTAVTVNGTTYPSNGTAPAGTVTFTSGTKTLGTVTLVPGFTPAGNAMATASITVNGASGYTSITATYNPSSGSNYTSSSASTALADSNGLLGNGNSSTSFTITDGNGIASPGPYPASDSLTLNIAVSTPGNQPNGECVLFFICSNTPTVNIYANGILFAGGLVPDANGNVTYTVAQQNGYLALPSGQVQLNVIYSGYSYQVLLNWFEVDASSSVQTITISDDRTNADFSLQSDTTVNQSSPLVSTGATQASYNLRLTSLYNFQGLSPSPAITLSCSVVGYSLGGVRITPQPIADLTCGFNSALTQTTASVTLGGTGYASQMLYVGAAPTYGIASNTAPAAPAGRWWMATGGTTLACIFLLGLPARRRKWQSLLGACVLVIVGFGMTGCGASWSNANGAAQPGQNGLNGGSTTSQGATGTPVPVGTYTVLVTATTIANTQIIHTLPVQVLVGTTN
jgi:subtilase family serine protease